MREPAFWWRNAGGLAAVLSPLAAIYGTAAAARMARPGARALVPVICVGNFTLGGSGKTPAAIALAHMLAAAGMRPALLSRGYGGSSAGPLRVDPLVQGAGQVGDEALLLAHAAPTFVARDRVAGAAAAAASGADIIVMDDGLQNASLIKGVTLAVVDGRRGIGNGKVFPAGPLRAPLTAQWPRVDALIVVGAAQGAAELIAQANARQSEVFHASLEPDRAAIAALQGRRLLAFAGIADPEKFFGTLDAAGLDAPLRKSFADHHRYSDEEAAALTMQAEHEGLELVTTQKDLARMAGVAGLAALRTRARSLPVSLKFAEADRLQQFVLSKLAART